MEETEIRSKLSTLIKNIMNLDMEKLNQNKHLGQIDEWDSFNNLMLVAEVEKTFSVSYTGAEIADIVTLNILVESIKSKTK